jgi:hypothetical protein
VDDDDGDDDDSSFNDDDMDGLVGDVDIPIRDDEGG